MLRKLFNIESKQQKQANDMYERACDDASLESAIVRHYKQHRNVSHLTIINGKAICDQVGSEGISVRPTMLNLDGRAYIFSAEFWPTGFNLTVC